MPGPTCRLAQGMRASVTATTATDARSGPGCVKRSTGRPMSVLSAADRASEGKFGGGPRGERRGARGRLKPGAAQIGISLGGSKEISQCHSTCAGSIVGHDRHPLRSGGFAMPLFMDVHHKVDGLTAEAVAGAHARDLEVQAAHDVNYLQYWFDEGSGKVFCLVDAPERGRRPRVSPGGPRAGCRRNHRSSGRSVGGPNVEHFGRGGAAIKRCVRRSGCRTRPARFGLGCPT